jgi:hypothetical protein
MELSNVRLCEILEVAIVLLQVAGVGALCLSRLFPSSRWATRGRAGVVVAMVGLAVAGAICGRQDSEFALFAGGTMTILLIGMTTGSHATDLSRPSALPVVAEIRLAA